MWKPSDQWSRVKCNLLLYVITTFMLATADIRNCGIPLKQWLCVYFTILVLDQIIIEFCGRMKQSRYWHGRRQLKKVISNSVMCTKEVTECIWIMHGLRLYRSDAANDCSEDNRGEMIVMLMLIILGMIKLVLFIVVVFIILYLLVAARLKRRRDRSRSRDVLRSLSRIPFSSLAQNVDEQPDEECIICFNSYTDADEVTQLTCNTKHIFHTACLSDWIRQGKNSCPICRQPINREIELN